MTWRLSARLLCALVAATAVAGYPAITHAALVAPGTTLDPGCAPTDANCGIATTTSVGVGIEGQVPYYAAAGSSLTATSSLTILQDGHVGIGTSSPFALLSIAGAPSAMEPLLAISTSTIASTATADEFDRNGNALLGLGGSYASVGTTTTGIVTVPGIYSYPAKFIVQGSTSDLSQYSFATVDSAGRLTSDIDNNGRMDLNNYSGVGAVFDLRNYASSTDGMVAGHYAYTAEDSSSNPSTVAYLLADLTNNTETSMSSKLELSFMNNVNAAPGGVYAYSQPNNTVTISAAGLDVPNIPITNVTTGTLNLGNGLYVSSPGLVSIGSSTTPFPLFVHVATNQNIRIRQNTNGAIEGVNDAENAFVPLQIDASSLLLNSATGGNVGIGTSSPTSKLTVSGTSVGPGIGNSAGQLLLDGSNANQRLVLGYDTTNNDGWIQAGLLGSAYEPLLLNAVGGDVGIGTSTVYSALEVWGPNAAATTTAFAVVNSASTTAFAVYDNGNATYSGSIFQSSDERLKTDVAALGASSSLAEIEGLTPVSYLRIDQPGGNTNLGFLAQAVQAIFPDLVSTTSATTLTPDGTLTLNYAGLIAPIVASIQALAAEVNGLSQSITTAVLHAGSGYFSSRICLSNSSNANVCITGDQLQQLLNASGPSSGTYDPSTANAGMDASTTEVAPADADPNSQDASSSDSVDMSATTTPVTTSASSTLALSEAYG